MELNTYGDLKKVIKSISLKQKGEKIGDIALDTVIGLIPGADVAKTTFDFIKAAFNKPDDKKTKTWLDKLDIDDKMSSIVDDTVENGFLKNLTKSIEGEDDNKPLEQDFNMNAKMVNYLKDKYDGRTISGIKENKIMKNQILRNLIKEEIKNILKEDTTDTTPTTKLPQEVVKLQKYLEGQGKSALSQINNPLELKNILTLIWNGMNESFRKNNPIALSLKKIIDAKIKD
jgi:hypothetical protein